MNVLVTGGSGNLAKYVAQEFADHNLLLVDMRRRRLASKK